MYTVPCIGILNRKGRLFFFYKVRGVRNPDLFLFIDESKTTSMKQISVFIKIVHFALN